MSFYIILVAKVKINYILDIFVNEGHIRLFII